MQPIPMNVATPPRAGTEIKKSPLLLNDFDQLSGMLCECIPCHLLVLLFILEKRLWHECWAFSRSAYPKYNY